MTRVPIQNGSGEADATKRATEGLRDLIIKRRLSPGQQVRQDDLAEQLGISRSPIREALKTLEAEGLVRHSPNQGYFVARLSADELTQVYLMRRLLETELLRTLRKPTTAELDGLSDLNGAVGAAVASASVAEMLAANRAFHFAMFDLSPLTLVRQQVERLWHLSESYRATYLWHPETRNRIVKEHEAMIAALRRGDRDRLVKLADLHRGAAEDSVLVQLQA